MKKIYLLCVLGIMLLASNGYAQSGNQNALENRAAAAGHACAQAYSGPHSFVYAELSGQGRCLDGGTTNIYTVKVGYTAPPPVLPYVLLPAPIAVATVVFDCDNRISSVTCE